MGGSSRYWRVVNRSSSTPCSYAAQITCVSDNFRGKITGKSLLSFPSLSVRFALTTYTQLRWHGMSKSGVVSQTYWITLNCRKHIKGKISERPTFGWWYRTRLSYFCSIGVFSPIVNVIWSSVLSARSSIFGVSFPALISWIGLTLGFSKSAKYDQHSMKVSVHP